MQTAPAYSLFTTLAGPLVGLLVVAVAGYFIVMRLRRDSRSDASDGTPFSLEDLRRLRREGKLTDEEYAKAHAMIVGAAKARLMPGDRPNERDAKEGIPPQTGDRRPPRDRSSQRPARRATEITILPEDPPPADDSDRADGLR